MTQATTPPPSLAPDMQGLHVLVLGLGQSGLAMARWCAQAGAQVWVQDTRATPPGLAALQLLPMFGQALQFKQVADFSAASLQEHTIRLVLLSPGLAPQQTAALVQAAEQVGIPCAGELSLFQQALRHAAQHANYHPQVLAITGTNGKTTVTALTHHLLQHAGLRAVMAGNIGPTLLDTLAQQCDVQQDPHSAWPQVWVLELSSFQLSSLGQHEVFAPDAATVLNISEDHLDWHADMDAYRAAKLRIFGPNTLRVLNRDDALAFVSPPVQSVQQGRKTVQRQPAYVTFGLDEPQHLTAYGLEQQHDVTWLVCTEDGGDSVKLQRLMPMQALKIKGLHNACNAMAALALARVTPAPMAQLLQALGDYAGEPHRVQWVRQIDGVDYYDDSKGTNVGATVAALQGLSGAAAQANGKVVVILGGDGKGQNFAPLAHAVAGCARACVLYGRDAPVIAKALEHAAVPLHFAQTLAEATTLAQSLACSGDAVLLSPACASFDMFRHYEHRAEVFVAAVQALTARKETTAC